MPNIHIVSLLYQTFLEMKNIKLIFNVSCNSNLGRGIEVYSLVKNFRPHTKLTLNDGFYFWIDKSEWTDDK